MIFRALDQSRPSRALADRFACAWPAYRRWWLSEGIEARPTYLACRRAIHKHMPELLALYDELCELVGGGDLPSRFLSLYNPPPYYAGCSQAVWPGAEPLLVRNYDYDPCACDGLLLYTDWLGQYRVLGMTDCVVGLLDGINDAGLAISLTFGGKRDVGAGFGVPIVLRYVLETCASAAAAAETLARIPCHMAYNVTVLDATGDYVTVMLGPGRKARVTRSPVATNHQESVSWGQHARATATVERERFLLDRMTLHPEPAEHFVAAFLRPPLYSMAFERGFGTLYTAEMWPATKRYILHWPSGRWALSLDEFRAGRQAITYLSRLGA